MEEQNEIDLIQLFAACIRRGRTAIITGLILAVLFGAYQYRTQLGKQLEAARIALDLEKLEDLYEIDNWKEKAIEANEHAYQVELNNYMEFKTNLNFQKDITQDKIAQQRKYIDESLLMTLDPYRVYTTKMFFTVVCTDDSAYSQQFAVTVTPDDYIYGKIINNYSIIWSGADLAVSLDLPGYENVANRYFRELLSLSTSGNNTLIITSKGESAEASEALCRAAYDFLRSQASVVTSNSYEHTVSSVNTVTTDNVDQGILNTQESAYAVLEDYKDTLTELDKDLEDLVRPQKPANQFVKPVIIFAIVGMFVGVACVGAAVTVQYIAGSVDNTNQLETCLHLVCLGRLPYRRGIFDKIADAIAGEHFWMDKDTALAYISGKSALQCCQRENIALFSTRPLASDQVADVLKALRKNTANVTYHGDYFHNPGAMDALQNCDSIVLIEEARKSKIGRIFAIVTYAKQLNKSVDGFVLI